MRKIFKIKKDYSERHLTLSCCGVKVHLRMTPAQVCHNVPEKYKKVLVKLQREVALRPLKVIFLVTEKQKWGYQSLYDLLLADKHFQPLVVVSKVVSDNSNVCSLEDNVDFFKKRNMDFVLGYENDEFVDLNKFEPDIIFYQQPWDLPYIHAPLNMFRTALCCYCSYSIASSKTASRHNKAFFYSLWKYFLAHETMKEECESWMECNAEALTVTGHPKLDVYDENNQTNKSLNKHYVIYAPHFSIGKSMLNFGTFEWSGQFMLEYAKKHPEITWVFKPHPRLRASFLAKEFMTFEELEDYFREWSKLGLVCEDGDYFDLFKNSDAMITDCGSFCVEYFLTGKPLFHLISENSKPHSALNRLVNKNHYSIFNQETLEQYLDEILIKKNDFLKPVRERQIKNIFSENFNSAENIIKYLKKELAI